VVVLLQSVETEAMSNITMNNSYASVMASKIENSSIVYNILGKSQEYIELLQQKKEYEEILGDISEDKVDRIKVYREKIETVNQKIDSFKVVVINLAKQFSEIQIDNERMRSARKHFEEGNLEQAQNALDEKELDNDLEKINLSKKEKEKQIEEDKVKLKEIAEQFLLKAKMASISYQDENRILTTKKFYQKSIDAFPYPSNIFGYFTFLREIKDLNASISLLKWRLTDATIEDFEKKSLLLMTGLLYMEINDEGKGKKLLKEAIAMKVKSNSYQFKDIEHINLIALLSYTIFELENGDYNNIDETIDFILTGRKQLSQQSPDLMVPFEIEALNQFAEVFIRKQKYEQAIVHFRTSVKLAREYFAEPVPLDYAQFPFGLSRLMPQNLYSLLEAGKINNDEVIELFELIVVIVNEHERIILESKGYSGYETLSRAYYFLFHIQFKFSAPEAKSYLEKAFHYLSDYRSNIQTNDTNSLYFAHVNAFIFDYALAGGVIKNLKEGIPFLQEIIAILDSIQEKNDVVLAMKNNLQQIIEKGVMEAV
jgi:hypothetical protein